MTAPTQVDRDAVLAALSTVNDPELHRDIVSLGMVEELTIEGGDITVKVELTTPACPLKDVIETDVRAALEILPGVEKVELDCGAQVRGSDPREGQKPIEGVRNLLLARLRRF